MRGVYVALFLFVFLFFLVIPTSSEAQPYLTENATWQWNLTGSSSESNTAVFGDIDNDGDL
ncbi:MAG: hypothetical protein KAS04_03305, partial [Candidatus Aenigmarchaeota archaeon]|nr:hypothetical protein [Candidatus Aenigmarchaeota archaeon]